MVDALAVGICLGTTDGVLLLSILPIVGIFFIILGLSTRVGFLGVFGSLMLVVFSWLLSSCVEIIGFILGAFSVILIFWFLLKDHNM